MKASLTRDSLDLVVDVSHLFYAPSKTIGVKWRLTYMHGS
jgi:hypothetical protein